MKIILSVIPAFWTLFLFCVSVFIFFFSLDQTLFAKVPINLFESIKFSLSIVIQLLFVLQLGYTLFAFLNKSKTFTISILAMSIGHIVGVIIGFFVTAAFALFGTPRLILATLLLLTSSLCIFLIRKNFSFAHPQFSFKGRNYVVYSYSVITFLLHAYIVVGAMAMSVTE